MADPPLTSAERRILEAIMAVRPFNVRDQTTGAIAERAGMGAVAARRVLRGLARRDPRLVFEDVDEGIGVSFWLTEYAAIDALEDPEDDPSPGGR
jgi:hypothetical protein